MKTLPATSLKRDYGRDAMLRISQYYLSCTSLSPCLFSCFFLFIIYSITNLPTYLSVLETRGYMPRHVLPRNDHIFLTKHDDCQKQLPEVFCKIVVLKNSRKFRGKHLL